MLSVRRSIPQRLIALSLLLLGCALPSIAAAQTTQSNQSTFPDQRRVHAVTLEHLYGHFLAYQNHLDSKGIELTAQGKDGKKLGKVLQHKLGFNDDDYSALSTSSSRLSGKVAALNARAAALRANGPTLPNQQAMMSLNSEREADLQAEISYLRHTLTPEQLRKFEAFLVNFFSPANAGRRQPNSNAQSVAPEVQK